MKPAIKNALHCNNPSPYKSEKKIKNNGNTAYILINDFEFFLLSQEYKSPNNTVLKDKIK